MSSPHRIRSFRLWTALAASLGMCTLATGIAGRRLQDPAQPTFRTGANYVRVDVFPTANGRPVADLAADDFEILEDNAPQKIDAFEHVAVRGGGPQPDAAQPNTLAESREQLQNGRSRVFVIFLDINQVEASASGKVRQPLINALNQLIAPDDLVAVMTPLMTARDLSFTRWTDATEGFIRKYWDWGQRDRATGADPREEDYKQCYPGMKSGREGCGDDRGVADKMIARRREKQTMDALQGLTDYLQTAREERKAVLVISDGWLLYRPDDTLRARTDCAPPKPKITMDPRTGKVTTKEPERPAAPTRSDVLCETDRLQLAAIDNRARMQDLQSQANRANVSFYPIDPRGLPATDVDLGAPRTGLPARGQTAVPTPAADSGMLRARQESLRDLAAATDGLALTASNDLEAGFRRVVADLSSYYLLSYYSTGKPDGKFHSIRVRVKRPGVQVRARRGFLAPTGDDAAQGNRTAGSNLPPGVAPSLAPVPSALTSLGTVARETRVRFATVAGWKPGNIATVWAVGELGTGEEWRSGASVDVVLADKTGQAITSAREQMAAGQRGFRVAIPVTDATHADYSVQIHVVPVTPLAGSKEPVSETLSVALPAAGLSSGSLVVRRGPTTGNRDTPAADLRFRRSEQIRIEVPDLVTESPSARLLDRNGHLLAVPVAAAIRTDADGSRWATAQVSLAPLTSGDYLIELTRQPNPEPTLVAFRIVP